MNNSAGDSKPSKRIHRFNALPVEDVVAKATKQMSTPCIVWTRATGSTNNRPILKVNGVTKHAYRALWEVKKGPIPEGMTIDHLCLNARCMNLDHYEVVTDAENAERDKAMNQPPPGIKSNNQTIRDIFEIITKKSLLSSEQLAEVMGVYRVDYAIAPGDNNV